MPATRIVKVQLVEHAGHRGPVHGRPAGPGIVPSPIEDAAAPARGCRVFPRLCRSHVPLGRQLQ